LAALYTAYVKPYVKRHKNGATNEIFQPHMAAPSMKSGIDSDDLPVYATSNSTGDRTIPDLEPELITKTPTCEWLDKFDHLKGESENIYAELAELDSWAYDKRSYFFAP
jgi:hypothetical protein